MNQAWSLHCLLITLVPPMSRRLVLILWLVVVLKGPTAAAPFFASSPGPVRKGVKGFLVNRGQEIFPIGCYELPPDEADLRMMAKCGFNLVRCRNAAELDRARAAGMLGWVSVPVQLGAAENALRSSVEAVWDHPALAVWEGPDEVVWNFTAYSGLYRDGIYKQRDEWWQQTPFAVKRAEEEARQLMPKLRGGCRLVRSLDRRRRPIWINEAADSDIKFMREYLDEVDITGCDRYPIHENNRLPAAVGDSTKRFQRIGQGKPVWMVLQGFSWHGLTPPKDQTLVYPSFVESRLMAYDAIAYGAKGILYWGTETVPRGSPFRESLLALTSELSAVQPFLISREQKDIRVLLTESNGRLNEGGQGVRLSARRTGSEWLFVLVNEDNAAYMAVELDGLGQLNGRALELLYGSETVTVKHGRFVTRLKPYEVKVFASSRKWESSHRSGREFQ